MQISIKHRRIKKNRIKAQKIKYFCLLSVIEPFGLDLRLFKISIIFLVVLTLFSCSTEKKSIINITYHNITSRYNGYFNAKESVREGLEKIKSNYTEDYTQLLPIYIEGDEAAARSVYPEMDVAIEKCSEVIQRHSMYIKKEEYCK